jgi:hypothetical protein
MINKLKNMIVATTLLCLPLMSIVLPVTVYAADPINDPLKCGAELTSKTDCTPAPIAETNTKVNNTITLVINIFSIVVGIVAVIMIVLGGLKYITSSGDANNITSAKNTILYAIVGLVVVALAQFIVRFVLGKVNAVPTP